MNQSAKIRGDQVEKIKPFLEDNDLSYRSLNDFVVKAVDNEIQLNILKESFTPAQKILFDLTFNLKLVEAYKEVCELK